MAVIRGRGLGLEVVLSGHSSLDDAVAALETKLSEQPGFYRGTAATVLFDGDAPDAVQLERLRAVLGEGGIELSGVLKPPAAQTPELAQRRAARPKREMHLSESAKSLVADFAGARADIAERRKRGEGSVPRVEARIADVKRPVAVVEAPPQTLYHTGTLRGGQALHNPGNIVVVGDVNPGAELVAGGDIVVFGRLAGVAHAGAKGDGTARVYALQLVPTQLRIATSIAAGDAARPAAVQPEAAYVHDGRIAIVAMDKLDSIPVKER